MSNDTHSEEELLRFFGVPRYGRVETLRRVRAWLLASNSRYRIIVLPETRIFVAPSATRAGVSWDVFIDQQQQIRCLCPDYKSHGHVCIHCGAVLFRFFPSYAPSPPTPHMLSQFAKRTHYKNARRSPRKVFIYKEGPAESTRRDHAIIKEEPRVEELLWDFASILDIGWMRTRKGPRLSPSQILSVLVLRQLHNKAMRRTRDLLRRSSFSKLPILPVKNTLIKYMKSIDTTRLLQRAFMITAAPFRLLEQDIIIDSSGFSPRFFESWLTVMVDDTARRGTRWFKVHVAKGRASEVILAFSMSPCDGESSADVVNLTPLVRAVVERGIDPRFVVADNIYLTKKLIEEVAATGARLVGPLKAKNIGRDGEGFASIRPIWEFSQAHPKLYDDLTRARQPIEGVFSDMKRKGGRVSSIGTAEERESQKVGEHDGLFVSTINEMWIRVILHNLRCINRQEELRNRFISLSKGSVFSHVRETIDEVA